MLAYCFCMALIICWVYYYKHLFSQPPCWGHSWFNIHYIHLKTPHNLKIVLTLFSQYECMPFYVLKVQHFV